MTNIDFFHNARLAAHETYMRNPCKPKSAPLCRRQIPASNNSFSAAPLIKTASESDRRNARRESKTKSQLRYADLHIRVGDEKDINAFIGDNFVPSHWAKH